ncbi:cation diffusion facilitator family transporter [Wukongibacter baidiensis]|uniref:cation diffusion facilitator family transporter n=1 Tax=Wukongibacter baidiensis TaxID=1723361 RepID=UPI003D800067
MNDVGKITDEERYRLGNKITWITIVINIILAVVKVLSGILLNSTAILADGIHTVSDVGSSIGIIIGFFISKKPEDREHQYGHEKAESIAGFVLAIFLTAVGINIGYSAFKIILSGKTHIPGSLAAWIAGISIVVKELQFRIAMYGGKRINSNALIADAWHHRSDAFSSIAALIGIVGARMGYPFLDPLAGLIVAIIIIRVGLELFIQGYNELMDISIEEEKLLNLVNKIVSHNEVLNINKIRTRKHGSKVFVDIKVCVNPYFTVLKGHTISHEVEDLVHDNIENVKDVLISIAPCKNPKKGDCLLCKYNNKK